MANVFAPFGFAQRSGTGSSPTYEQVVLPIASTNATPIFFGDPVVQATGTTGLPTGFIQQAPPNPLTLAITGGVVTAGVMVFTFTANTAPPVGSFLLVTGGTTTAGTANGAYQVLASTTTTATVQFGGGSYTTGSATGYVFQQLAGVFAGCTFVSVVQKRQIWSNYWPGSDANGNVTGYCITDPNAQFTVQTGNSNTTATAFGVATIGQNIGFNFNDFTGTGETNGNTANGLSTYFADQYTLPATNLGGVGANAFLPFRIISLVNSPLGTASALSGQNGSDPTTAYNYVVVGFNNAVSKQLYSI